MTTMTRRVQTEEERQAELEIAAARVLASSPPLTDEQVERIAERLRGSGWPNAYRGVDAPSPVITTPGQLARELDVSAETIRTFLRKQYAHHEHHTPWELTDDQATVVRSRFSD